MVEKKKIFFAQGTFGDDDGSDSGSDNEDKKQKKVTIATIPEEPLEEAKLINKVVEKREVEVVQTVVQPPPPKQQEKKRVEVNFSANENRDAEYFTTEYAGTFFDDAEA